MKKQPTRQSRIKKLLFGTSTFRSPEHELSTYVITGIFFWFSLRLLIESLELQDYFLGIALAISLPLVAISAWADWRDRIDG